MKVGPLTRYILYTTTKLTKKDAVVIWRGTRDIGRNEAKKALQQILHNLHNRICDNIFMIISKVEEKKCVSVNWNMFSFIHSFIFILLIHTRLNNP